MLKELHLQNFKGFADATLSLGPLTTLVGTNASGKSNVRDALRFLHGVARGYSLADIIGEKWGEGGVLQWRGIRGGSAEAAYLGRSSFALEAKFNITNGLLLPETGAYMIEVEPGRNGKPRVIRESLYAAGTMMFDSHPPQNPPQQTDPQHLAVRILAGGQYKKGPVENLIAQQPVLSQILDRLVVRKDPSADKVQTSVKAALAAFGSMRFLDLSPEAMRLPSLPGQTTLGDRGENLSSVLQAIYEQPQRKSALVEWLRELTPMDVADLEFPADQTGRVLVTLVEQDGQKTSAYSASDGTLRFLAMLAALLGPEPSRLYFIEELENGLHPARLYLLLDLIEKRTAAGDIQVVATTHSPQQVRLLTTASQQSSSLCYRLAGHSEARIRRLLDLPPEARQVIEDGDLGHLYQSGWFENIMSYMEEEEG